MGKFNDLKLWYICKKTGRIEEYETYKHYLKNIKYDIDRFNKYLHDATQRLEDIKRRFPEDSKEYIYARDKVSRWTHSLYEAKLEIKFIRPNSQEDIDYRNYQGDNFANNLQAVLSKNFDLRFHRTPIYFAEQIIKSGGIYSTADRFDGYIKSTDMKGEISASDRNSIDRTIQFFSNIASYQRSLPCGCIFALLPRDEEDATYAHDMMHSVNFRENPEQFFGVFTTPENIKQVKGWMEEAGFNPNTVYTFEEFIKVVETKSKIIDDNIKVKYKTNIDNNDSSKVDNKNNSINPINICDKDVDAGGEEL